MADFNAVFEDLKKGVADIAKHEAKDYAQQAQADGEAFLNAAKADLETWSRQLAKGEMSKEDFAFLVRGKKSLAEMKALTQAGIAAARIERIRNAIVELAVDSASKLI